MRQRQATGIGALASGIALLVANVAIAAPDRVPLPRPRPDLTAGQSVAVDQATPPPVRNLNSVPIVPFGLQRVVPSPPAPVAQAPAAPAQPVTAFAQAATAATSAADVALVKKAIDLAQAGKSERATALAGTIKDPFARKLVEWVVLRSDDDGLPFARYAAFISANPDWPNIFYLRRRAEAVLWQDRVGPEPIRAFFAKTKPMTAKGRFALARALLAAGDRTGAARHAREAWRDDDFSGDLEDQALAAFGDLLTRADHKARMDARLYARDTQAAMRTAKRLGATQIAIARAWVAVDKRSRHAGKLLKAVHSSAQRDPGHMYSHIRWLRRAEKDVAAAKLLAEAPREAARIVDPDKWWIERRLVARALLEKGQPRLAYQVVSQAVQPAAENYRAESQFMSGWIALRFLRDAKTAERHFARVAAGIVHPITRGRAAYWQGRAAEAAGKREDARRHYSEAAKYPTAYYGQLARAKLGLKNIALSRPPALSAGQRANIERLEVVRAARLLYAAGEDSLVASLVYDLAGRLDELAVLTVLAELAVKNGDARATLLIGKVAHGRGLPLGAYAFPAFGIPKYERIGPPAAKALVYAIARQESGFRQSVRSHANAIGLMQVVPSTARYIARRNNVKYSQRRLRTDPVYNVQLGAAELGDLMQDYRGSYILTFVGYNAGRGRVQEWVKRFGDPRDPKVDPIDWVERIPFSETRNYVQRILENLQVYRTLFGDSSRLMIEADLRRGTAAN